MGIDIRRVRNRCSAQRQRTLSKECLVSSLNSNRLTLESVAEWEERVTRYPFALLCRKISDKWGELRALLRVYTHDGVILHTAL